MVPVPPKGSLQQSYENPMNLILRIGVSKITLSSKGTLNPNITPYNPSFHFIFYFLFHLIFHYPNITPIYTLYYVLCQRKLLEEEGLRVSKLYRCFQQLNL